MRSFILIIVLANLLSDNVWCRPGIESSDEKRSIDSIEDVITLPFYGGAKGQLLEIRKHSNGTISSEIIKDDKNVAADSNSPFQMNLQSIQTAAGELLRIQQNIKANGVLDQNDQKLYADSLEKLGISAQNLAHIQMSGDGGSDDRGDDLRLLFDGKIANRIHTIKGNKQDANEDVGEETYIEPIVYDNAVEIGQPTKEEVSIAEAKPVGLAVAGKGGVAASKPVATAIVGPGGLAVSRPTATALADVSPSELSGVNIPSLPGAAHRLQQHVLPSHRYGLINKDSNDYLVDYLTELRNKEKFNRVETDENLKLLEQYAPFDSSELALSFQNFEYPSYYTPQLGSPAFSPEQYKFLSEPYKLLPGEQYKYLEDQRSSPILRAGEGNKYLYNSLYTPEYFQGLSHQSYPWQTLTTQPISLKSAISTKPLNQEFPIQPYPFLPALSTYSTNPYYYYGLHKK